MTTTENPTGSLTRRQLRELRLTGQTPHVTGEGQVATPAPQPTPPRREAPPTIEPMRPSVAAVETPAPAAEAPAPAFEAPAAPEPPAPAPSPWEAPRQSSAQEAPVAPSDEDEHDEDRPRSRREARELERVRTGAINIIPTTPGPEPLAGSGIESTDRAHPSSQAAPWTAAAEAVADEVDVATDPRPVHAEPMPTDADRAREAAAQRPTVRSGFGAAVLDAPEPAPATTFDELITRDSSGTASAGSALILGDEMLPPLTAPVASTGQTLVTGTFNLPDGLGSRGHAPGVADGKEVDAVLIDGELPASSSPTPIAATAAVNQAKAPGEIMQPPAPEKGNRVMLWLAISAGALAAALTAVVVWAWMTQALG